MFLPVVDRTPELLSNAMLLVLIDGSRKGISGRRLWTLVRGAWVLVGCTLCESFVVFLCFSCLLLFMFDVCLLRLSVLSSFRLRLRRRISAPKVYLDSYMRIDQTNSAYGPYPSVYILAPCLASPKDLDICTILVIASAYKFLYRDKYSTLKVCLLPREYWYEWTKAVSSSGHEQQLDFTQHQQTILTSDSMTSSCLH